jgi:hypothetical protein
MKALGSTSRISKSDTEVVTDSPKSDLRLCLYNHRKEQTIMQVCNSSPSEESLRCHWTDAYLFLHEGKDKIHTSMLRMIPNPSSPVFTLMERAPLGEVTMNTLFLLTSYHSSSNDTSAAALQLENGDLPVILSSSVGLLVN